MMTYSSLLKKRNGGIGKERQACPRLGQGIGGCRWWVIGPRELAGELVVQVWGKEVHLGPAPKPEQTVRNPWTEMPLCGVSAISQQVVCQLVVDVWSVNYLEPESDLQIAHSYRVQVLALRVFETTPPCLFMYDTVAVLLSNSMFFHKIKILF